MGDLGRSGVVKKGGVVARLGTSILGTDPTTVYGHHQGYGGRKAAYYLSDAGLRTGRASGIGFLQSISGTGFTMTPFPDCAIVYTRAQVCNPSGSPPLSPVTNHECPAARRHFDRPGPAPSDPISKYPGSQSLPSTFVAKR